MIATAADHISFLNRLLAARGDLVAGDGNVMLQEFAERPEIVDAVARIKELQDTLSMRWKTAVRVKNIHQLQIPMPNATVGKPYSAIINRKELGLEDLSHFELVGLEDLGLAFDRNASVINGTPSTSGDYMVVLRFRLAEEGEDDPIHEKAIPFLINPDPRSLWKDLPSAVRDPSWKADQVAETASLGDKRIVVASKRGRSHANVGSFRDDDYAYGVNGIPHMVIIGRDGKILNIHRGYSEASLDGFVAEINAALAKG